MPMIAGELPIRRVAIKPVIAILLLLLCALGCGKKQMPSPPRQVPPQPVTDLSARLTGNQVELTWSYSKALSGSEPITGFGVFRASDSIAEDCSGCPFLFHRVADIPFVDGQGGASAMMTYRDILEKGYRYRYKVICYSKGLASRDSNLVVVDEGE